ncbi:hypothetical protein AGABI2DRAFT_73503, partial [Agaricus bisporus var. bisporus H97]|uniref:hypothetical protein n=1 Tax=Agaricus bisporus var. bisporus (strain H97 / ATCC MYA-4626 / FGSC 10389) TaxID=936046 RepID=UPI00029F5C46
PTRHVRPLSASRAIKNGANLFAEVFLFTVAASLIFGETWRPSRSQSKRINEETRWMILSKKSFQAFSGISGPEHRLKIVLFLEQCENMISQSSGKLL